MFKENKIHELGVHIYYKHVWFALQSTRLKEILWAISGSVPLIRLKDIMGVTLDVTTSR